MKEKSNVPKPGTKEAIKKGCICMQTNGDTFDARCLVHGFPDIHHKWVRKRIELEWLERTWKKS